MPTEEEILARAKVWADALFGIIPEERLPDVFRSAFQHHESTFPINAYEIKATWDGIAAQEAHEPAKKSPETCSNRANHNDEILCEYGLPGATRWMPCHECRRSAFEQRSAETIKTVPIKRLIGEVARFETSVALVSRIISILRQEMIKAIGTDEYKPIRAAIEFWKRVLIRVGDLEWNKQAADIFQRENDQPF